MFGQCRQCVCMWFTGLRNFSVAVFVRCTYVRTSIYSSFGSCRKPLKQLLCSTRPIKSGASARGSLLPCFPVSRHLLHQYITFARPIYIKYMNNLLRRFCVLSSYSLPLSVHKSQIGFFLTIAPPKKFFKETGHQ